MRIKEHRHRGAHPSDKDCFDEKLLPILRMAVADVSWLLSRDYVMHSVLELVGNHFNLSQRQRMAVSRAACSERSRDARMEKCLPLKKIKNKRVIIDGFNLIITIETALSGGIVYQCRDKCVRDIAGVHGSYHLVHETRQAIELVGIALAAFEPEAVLWLFDKPVSNSGRIAAAVRDVGMENHWPWKAEVHEDPDQKIVSAGQIAISSDSLILDNVKKWVNLGSWLIHKYIPEAWIIEISGDLPDAWEDN